MIALLFISALSLKHHEQGMKAFNEARFPDAVEAFRGALLPIGKNDAPVVMELVAREKLVLSLYQSERLLEARAELTLLRARFPDFRWNPHEVTPETIAELDIPAPAPPRDFVYTPTVPTPMWQWYFLAPFGIGQYLAGSPVRGTLFLSLELGFLAANITGAILLGNQLLPDGTVPAKAPAERAIWVMNIGFFGLIASLIGGIIDGALERNQN